MRSRLAQIERKPHTRTVGTQIVTTEKFKESSSQELEQPVVHLDPPSFIGPPPSTPSAVNSKAQETPTPVPASGPSGSARSLTPRGSLHTPQVDISRSAANQNTKQTPKRSATTSQSSVCVSQLNSATVTKAAPCSLPSAVTAGITSVHGAPSTIRIPTSSNCFSSLAYSVDTTSSTTAISPVSGTPSTSSNVVASRITIISPVISSSSAATLSSKFATPRFASVVSIPTVTSPMVVTTGVRQSSTPASIKAALSTPPASAVTAVLNGIRLSTAESADSGSLKARLASPIADSRKPSVVKISLTPSSLSSQSAFGIKSPAIGEAALRSDNTKLPERCGAETYVTGSTLVVSAAPIGALNSKGSHFMSLTSKSNEAFLNTTSGRVVTSQSISSPSRSKASVTRSSMSSYKVPGALLYVKPSDNSSNQPASGLQVMSNISDVPESAVKLINNSISSIVSSISALVSTNAAMPNKIMTSAASVLSSNSVAVPAEDLNTLSAILSHSELGTGTPRVFSPAVSLAHKPVTSQACNNSVTSALGTPVTSQVDALAGVRVDRFVSSSIQNTVKSQLEKHAQTTSTLSFTPMSTVIRDITVHGTLVYSAASISPSDLGPLPENPQSGRSLSAAGDHLFQAVASQLNPVTSASVLKATFAIGAVPTSLTLIPSSHSLTSTNTATTVLSTVGASTTTALLSVVAPSTTVLSSVVVPSAATAISSNISSSVAYNVHLNKVLRSSAPSKCVISNTSAAPANLSTLIPTLLETPRVGPATYPVKYAEKPVMSTVIGVGAQKSPGQGGTYAFLKNGSTALVSTAFSIVSAAPTVTFSSPASLLGQIESQAKPLGESSLGSSTHHPLATVSETGEHISRFKLPAAITVSANILPVTTAVGVSAACCQETSLSASNVLYNISLSSKVSNVINPATSAGKPLFIRGAISKEVVSYLGSAISSVTHKPISSQFTLPCSAAMEENILNNVVPATSQSSTNDAPALTARGGTMSTSITSCVERSSALSYVSVPSVPVSTKMDIPAIPTQASHDKKKETCLVWTCDKSTSTVRETHPNARLASHDKSGETSVVSTTCGKLTPAVKEPPPNVQLASHDKSRETSVVLITCGELTPKVNEPPPSLQLSPHNMSRETLAVLTTSGKSTTAVKEEHPNLQLASFNATQNGLVIADVCATVKPASTYQPNNTSKKESSLATAPTAAAQENDSSAKVQSSEIVSYPLAITDLTNSLTNLTPLCRKVPSNRFAKKSTTSRTVVLKNTGIKEMALCNEFATPTPIASPSPEVIKTDKLANLPEFKPAIAQLDIPKANRRRYARKSTALQNIKLRSHATASVSADVSDDVIDLTCDDDEVVRDSKAAQPPFLSLANASLNTSNTLSPSVSGLAGATSSLGGGGGSHKIVAKEHNVRNTPPALASIVKHRSEASRVSLTSTGDASASYSFEMKPPPRPTLEITCDTSVGINLQWNMDLSPHHAEISNYHIYGCKQKDGHQSKTALWKKIGDLKALPLPMACTLTQFHPGHTYQFAIRAVDIYQRVGEFSSPKSFKNS